MGRVTVTQRDGYTEFRVAPLRDEQTIFLVVWWAGWIFLAWKFANDIVQGRGSLLDVSLWMLIAAVVGYQTTWWMFGAEIVRVTAVAMTVRTNMFGLVQTRLYQMDDVRNLRVEHPFEHTSWAPWIKWYWRMPMIAFDYRGKTRRFGIALDRQTANDLIAEMRRCFRRA